MANDRDEIINLIKSHIRVGDMVYPDKIADIIVNSDWWHVRVPPLPARRPGH